MTKTGSYLTLDHKIPKSKKGGSKEENLQIMCNLCNSMKSNTVLPPISVKILRNCQEHMSKKAFKKLRHTFIKKQHLLAKG